MGKARGKVGGVVFRVVDGKQVMSELNNKPYNPKSFGQERQRTKFAFVQSLLSQIPSPALVGLGGRDAANRAELSRSVFRGVTASGSTIEELQFTMDLHSVVLSRGNVQAPSRTVTLTWSERSEGILVKAEPVEGVAEPVYAVERMMVVVAPSTADYGDKPLVKYLEGGGVIDTLVPLPKAWWDTNLSVTVFVWGAVTADSLASTNISSVQGNAVARLISSVNQEDTEVLLWSPSVVAYEGIFNAEQG